MDNSRPPRHRGPVEVWERTTTPGEVLKWASGRLADFMVLYADAAIKQDAAHMEEDTKLMRAVVTRLEQYARMKKRHWNAAASAPKPEQEKIT
jgi:hypothetical protein